MKDDIKDNEIRFLGSKQSAMPETNPHKVAWWFGLVAVFVSLAVGLAVILTRTHTQPKDDVVGVFEENPVQSQPHPLRGWLALSDSCISKGVWQKDTIVNDIPLLLLLPLNSFPHLEVGYGCLRDTLNMVLCCQAADVRADNKKIVGAFVLRGKPLSWGLSKRGYCAIIDTTVYVGVADNSPLFEQATECGGDFFRQYPLVDKGRLVENELKNKFLRRALCYIDGYIMVVETRSNESLHDFAQALVDIGVDEAIYLTGGTSFRWYVDTDGNRDILEMKGQKAYKNISFIIWQ